MRYCLILLCVILLTACGEQEQSNENPKKNTEEEIELPESIVKARALLDSETDRRTSDEVLGKKASTNKPKEVAADEESSENTDEEANESVDEFNQRVDEWQEELDESLDQWHKELDEWEEQASDGIEKLNALTNITFKVNGNNVEMTVPAAITKGSSQDVIDKEAKAKGYKSAKKNSDGSVTYTMSKQKHAEMMEDAKDDMKSSIMEDANVSDVKFNDDLSVIEIYLKSEPTSEDQSLKISVPIQAKYYYMISGYNPGKTEVRLLDKSGELYQ